MAGDSFLASDAESSALDGDNARRQESRCVLEACPAYSLTIEKDDLLKLQIHYNMQHDPAALRASILSFVASGIVSHQSARVATTLQFDQGTDARFRATEDVSDVMLLTAPQFDAYVGFWENTDTVIAASEIQPAFRRAERRAQEGRCSSRRLRRH